MQLSDHEIVEDFNKAASKIQTWWRRHKMRKQVAKAALKRFMLENAKMVSPRSRKFISPIEEAMREKHNNRSKLMPRGNFAKEKEKPVVEQPKSIKKEDLNNNNEPSYRQNRSDLRNSCIDIFTSTKEKTYEDLSTKSKEYCEGKAFSIIHLPKDKRSFYFEKSNNETVNSSQETLDTDEINQSQEDIIPTISKEDINPQLSDDEGGGRQKFNTTAVLNNIFDTNACNQVAAVQPMDDATSKWVMMVNDIEKLLHEDANERLNNTLSPRSTHETSIEQEVKNTAQKIQKSLGKKIASIPHRQTNTGKIYSKKFNSINLRKESGDNKKVHASLPDINSCSPRVAKKPNINRDFELTAQTQMAVADVTSQVLNQQRKVSEQSGVIDRYRRELEHARELNTRQLQDTQKEFEKRLAMERDEHSVTLQRNYKLIDELIAEKKQLHMKCDQLVKDMKTVSQKAEDKIKHITDDHQVQLKKFEGKLVASEKIRREKWEKDKALSIKNSTVKTMESEINKILKNHKEELVKLRNECQSRINEADDRAFTIYAKKLEEMKYDLKEAKEHELAIEKDAYAKKCEQEMDEERASFELQKRRMNNDFEHEYHKLKNEMDIERTNLDSEISRLKTELTHHFKIHEEDIEKVKRSAAEDFERRALEYRKREEEDRRSWEEHKLSVYEAKAASRERELREQFKKERDHQLETAMRKVEFQTSENIKQIEEDFEKRINRIKSKMQAEIDELEKSEKQLMEKYNVIKSKNMDKSSEVDHLRMKIMQKEEEINELREHHDKLSRERENFSEIIRQEFADKLVRYGDENVVLKNDVAEQKATISSMMEKHTREMTNVRKEASERMEHVRNKVKEALQKKDDDITTQRQKFQLKIDELEIKLSSSERRVVHFEELLDEQRKQLLQLKKH